MDGKFIHIRGAKQNNLKNLDIKIPLNALTVLTGVSGSGKSTVAFDILYAEGQRRYVESFSAYARQFLDRMDKPDVESIEGIPPTIAIDQSRPVRTSRSTVGTMTELHDHFKLLFSKIAVLFCRGCARPVERDSAQSDETQIFIETPYRNDAMLADILQACRDDTRLAIAAGLTGTDEKIRMDAIASWRERPASLGKMPAVFLLLAAPRRR